MIAILTDGPIDLVEPRKLRADFLQRSAAACDASLVIATHDQRVMQALAGVQTLDLNEVGLQPLLDKRGKL